MSLKIIWCWGKTDAELDEVIARVAVQNGGGNNVKATSKSWVNIYRMRATKDGNNCPEIELPSLSPPTNEHKFVGVVVLE